MTSSFRQKKPLHTRDDDNRFDRIYCDICRDCIMPERELIHLVTNDSHAEPVAILCDRCFKEYYEEITDETEDAAVENLEEVLDEFANKIIMMNKLGGGHVVQDQAK